MNVTDLATALDVLGTIHTAMEHAKLDQAQRATVCRVSVVWTRGGRRQLGAIRTRRRRKAGGGVLFEDYTELEIIDLRLASILKHDSELLRSTFLHEVAHLIAESASKATVGHGWGWQRVMRTMGLKPDRCTDHEDRARVEKILAERGTPLKVIAKCDACGFEWRRARRLTGRKWLSASLGGLIHRRCGGRLRPTDDT